MDHFTNNTGIAPSLEHRPRTHCLHILRGNAHAIPMPTGKSYGRDVLFFSNLHASTYYLPLVSVLVVLPVSKTSKFEIAPTDRRNRWIWKGNTGNQPDSGDLSADRHRSLIENNSISSSPLSSYHAVQLHPFICFDCRLHCTCSARIRIPHPATYMFIEMFFRGIENDCISGENQGYCYVLSRSQNKS
jgi:hypothetical protein